MMRLLDRRWLAAGAAVLAALFVWGNWRDVIVEKAEFALHPPAPVSSPLAADLKRDVQARDSAKLKGLYRRVNAELAAARARGAQVENLQALADSAMELDSEKYRAAAMERLNKIRLVIPQPKAAILPAGPDDLNPEKPIESPAPKAKKRR